MAPAGDTRVSHSVSPRSAAFGWATIAIGLALALLLIAPAVRDAMAEQITVESIVAANLLFYAVLFGPLVVLALVLGAVDKRPVMRAGRAPLRWSAIGLAIGVCGLATCVV